MRSILTFAALLFASSALAQSSLDDPPQLTVEQQQWGFDGKVHTPAFVPVSFLIRNDAPLPFDGPVRLHKALNLVDQVDALIERTVYIGPGETRWVQFTPYLPGVWEQFLLRWGDEKDAQYDVPTPQSGGPATVLLFNEDELPRATGGLRRLPAALFPPSVTSTDTLWGLAIDTTPKWQQARRQACIDWLRTGGRVFLLRGPDGNDPTFADELTPLNQSADEFLVGAGRVRRINQPLSKLSRRFIDTELRSSQSTDTYENIYNTNQPVLAYDRTALPMLDATGLGREAALFKHLVPLSRFARRWWLIYGVAVLYVFAFWSVCFNTDRRVLDRRRFFGTFLLTVMLFSVGFTVAGLPSGSTQNRVRSLAIAHHLDGGNYDVTQWSSVAAWAGGTYEIKHNGSGRLYSTSQQLERVYGTIVQGPQARMTVEMPPNSARMCLHRSRLPGPEAPLSVSRIATEGGRLNELSVSFSPVIMEEGALAYASYGGTIYPLRAAEGSSPSKTSTLFKISGRVTSAGTTKGQPLTEYLASRLVQSPSIGWSTRMQPETLPDDLTDQQLYARLLRPLIGYSYQLDVDIDPKLLAMDDNLVRVFLYTRMPATMHVLGDRFADQTGAVLWVFDVRM